MRSVITSPEVQNDSTVDGTEHFEIINGMRVESPPMGAYQSVLASYLLEIVGPFARTNNLGRVVSETLFQLDRQGQLQRRPDVSFVSYQRWPKNRPIPETNAWDVVPELAIEVNSPSNTANEILQKIQDYFHSGVHCVWVVYPVAEQVYVYSSPARIVILTKKDQLDGAALLPGFQFPVAGLFEPGPVDVSATPPS